MRYTFKIQAVLSMPSILDLSVLDEEEMQHLSYVLKPDEEYSVTLQYLYDDGTLTLLGVDDLLVIADQLISLENGLVKYESEF